MTNPHIRCAFMPDGNIEAAISLSQRLVVDCRTGAVIETTVSEGTDAFRWLVVEARRHVSK